MFSVCTTTRCSRCKMALELEKIARPRQFYTGQQRREFVPISGR